MALKVVILVGGGGGAKLAHGLAQILPPKQLSIIVNTGDDFWLYGLRVCPDLDTMMYTLAGMIDKTNGWGLTGDTVHVLDSLRRFGEDTWFRLGDQDIATHLLRTERLRAGERLTDIMQNLANNLGVDQRLLPMTDAPVATTLDTLEQGELEFQRYFVQYRWQPTVTGIRLAGIEQAAMSPEVAAAISGADAIVIGPSNPWLSIAPILAVPGLRAALVQRDVPRVAVTPIVAGQALKGPAAKLMAELKYEPSAKSVAGYYGSLINGFIYDEQDEPAPMFPVRATKMDTVMRSDDQRAVFAHNILHWIESWNEA